MSVYQDLVEREGFSHDYNSVKRFVAKLRARDPERFDVLEFPPAEECQVDYGQRAPEYLHHKQVGAAMPSAGSVSQPSILLLDRLAPPTSTSLEAQGGRRAGCQTIRKILGSNPSRHHPGAQAQ